MLSALQLFRTSISIFPWYENNLMCQKAVIVCTTNMFCECRASWWELYEEMSTFDQQLYTASSGVWTEHGNSTCKPSQIQNSFHRELERGNTPLTESPLHLNSHGVHNDNAPAFNCVKEQSSVISRQSKFTMVDVQSSVTNEACQLTLRNGTD